MYITVIAFVAKGVSSHELTAALLLVGLWISGALFLQFYERENLEISRLGSIIRERITPLAVNILQIDQRDLFPSETNHAFPQFDVITSRYDHQIKWVLFLVIPLAITVLYLSEDWYWVSKALDFCKRDPYMAIVSVGFGLRTLYLLVKYSWIKRLSVE
ncbi:MAG: hypothetical protein KZQ92_06750 [Candidatus Thiodiazotropha sp. (ex Lucinoma borealis)]|nr:hypothetical protein [Candidatus Thiodiazotropha sp. (ex Lucinoma borealis)]